MVSEGRGHAWLPETASSDSRTSQGLIRDGVEPVPTKRGGKKQVGRGGTRPYRTDRTTWKASLPMTLNASLPTEIMRPALKRPVVQSLRQALPHRVLADVLELILVFPLVAEAVVERAALKRPRLGQMRAAELAFPKLYPLIDAEVQIARGAEEVQVVGHEQVVAGEPGGGFVAPEADEGFLHGGLGHPRHAVLGVDNDEEEVAFAQMKVRAARRGLAPDVRPQGSVFGHVLVEGNGGLGRREERGEEEKSDAVERVNLVDDFHIVPDQSRLGVAGKGNIWDGVERVPTDGGGAARGRDDFHLVPLFGVCRESRAVKVEL